MLPPLYDFKLNDAESVDWTKSSMKIHSALLPHEVFATLYEAAPDLFRHLMYGDEDNLCRFWDGLERTDSRFCRDHPVVQSCAPNQRMPLEIHGDDAGLAGRQQVLGISWGSVCLPLIVVFALRL